MISFPALVLALFCLIESPDALAQSQQGGGGDAGSADVSSDDWAYSITVANWNNQLDRVRSYIDLGASDPARTEEALDTLSGVREGAQAEKSKAEDALAQAQSRLDALGPKPVEGEPPEPSDIRRKRDQIQQEINFYKSRVSLADLALTRVNGLEQGLSRSERALLIDRLTTRGPLPFDPSTVFEAVGDMSAFLTGIVNTAHGWWTGLPYADRSIERLVIRILAFVAGAFLIAYLVRMLLLRRFGAHPTDEPPAYRQRLLAAVAEGLSKGLIPATILGIIVARTQTESAPISGDLGDLVGLAAVMIIIYIVATSLPHSVLSPDYPEWRLTRLDPANARRILALIRVIAVLFCVDEFLVEASERVASLQNLRTPELNAVWTLIFNVAQGLCIFALLRPSLWRLTDAPEESIDDEDGPPRPYANAATESEAANRAGDTDDEAEDDGASDPPVDQPAGLVGAARAARAGAGAGFWKILRFALASIAVVGMLAPLAGYTALANYLLNNLLGTGLVVGALYILRGLFREMIGLASSSSLLRDRIGIDYRARSRIKFWFRAALDILIIVIGVLMIAPNWGLSRSEILRWIKEGFEGFTIGNVTISIADIAFGLIAFAVVLGLTGTTKRMLAERVLPETEIDEGVQHSVTAGVGYAGFVIALALSIAVMGVDLSNIAIIAGALSVGIGFGLQNIVNNFVSGLILLIERPIKAGDWVVVGENEGFVKQVSLRATEIETWHRASVIVPNADLLSSALKNWTLKDKYGRVDMPIGVALDSDPKQVERILLQVARRHPRVVRWPQPVVLLMSVGESRLQFELRVFTDDILWVMFIASELRIETLRRFREEGIVVPFDQTVVHLERGDPRQPPRDESGAIIRRSGGVQRSTGPIPTAIQHPSRDGKSEGPNEGPASGAPEGGEGR
ncbi:mechanosensitive ion channel family protein [Marivibrio halodurans]|uniref:Mechanosensitive ion channel family protein n=1 Tax=Marivibrio halodurans TaxID=2039722 RepID=A0A8J7V509_9PROT|nr:mechanosensitive ion channel domain-containing protein [Marivibrio halodurans]MBP5858304.1 mechanosensitive ion channel family protein [Marivibrio halodurans]